MSNKVWVGFDCRTTTRRPGSSKNVRCRSCSKQCEYLGYKVTVPTKSQIKKWQALLEAFYQSKKEYLLNREKHCVHAIHNVEQKIDRLEALAENKGRAIEIKRLKKLLLEFEDS